MLLANGEAANWRCCVQVVSWCRVVRRGYKVLILGGLRCGNGMG